MKIIDKLLNRLNPQVELKFNSLRSNYNKGFGRWCTQNRITSNTNFSFSFMKLSLENESLIIKLHSTVLEEERLTKIKEDISSLDQIKQQYPRGFIVVCNKYLGGIIYEEIRMPGVCKSFYEMDTNPSWIPDKNGFYLGKYYLIGTNPNFGNHQIKEEYPHPPTTIAQLKYEHVLMLLGHQDEIIEEDKIVNEALANEDIRIQFEDEVLDNPLRTKYYKNYLGNPPHISNSERKAVLANLKQLDQFISAYLEEQYLVFSGAYPQGLQDYELEVSSESLSRQEFLDKCFSNEKRIQELQDIADDYQDIIKLYPNAYKVYSKRNTCSHALTKEEFINLGEKKIREIEEKYRDSIAFYTWLDENAKYQDSCREIMKNIFKGWGAYSYEHEVSIPGLYKDNDTIKIDTWQFFLHSYCIEQDLDYTLCKSQKEHFQRLPSFRACTRYFVPDIYDNIVKFILEVKKRYHNCLVLFGNSLTENEQDNHTEFNKQHLQHFVEELEKNRITYGSELINKEAPFLYKYIVIVEVISSTYSYKIQCHRILENFLNEKPNICFISLLKEMNRDEMTKIISRRTNEEETRKKKLEEEENIRLEKERKQRALENKRRENIAVLKNCVKNWNTPTRSSIKCFSMFYYYPTTCEWEASEEEWEVRNLIWDFKANPHKSLPIRQVMTLHHNACTKIVNYMYECLDYFFDDNVSQLTLVCIPSSQRIITERRYTDFSEMICNKTGMSNGYKYVHVVQDGEAKHTGGTKKASYSFDLDFFKGKNILLFDDVITSGSSMEQFKSQLEALGATVIGGFSIGRTKHEEQDFNPIDELI